MFFLMITVLLNPQITITVRIQQQDPFYIHEVDMGLLRNPHDFDLMLSTITTYIRTMLPFLTNNGFSHYHRWQMNIIPMRH